MHNRTNNNVGDAVMAHFNSIQRGEFHPNLPNVINPNSHGRGIRSPLDQFEIRDFLSFNAPLLADIHLSFTNIGLYLTIATFSALALNFLATNYNKIIANK
jgi:F-type H+-transporting ATPase subunit a